MRKGLPKRGLVRGQDWATEIFLQRLDNSGRAEAAFVYGPIILSSLG